MNLRKRKFLPKLATHLGAMMVFMFLTAMPAFAVHDQDFELEGNVANNGADVQGNQDWVNLFDVSAGVATPKATLPTGFGPATFFRDFKLKANGAFDTSDDSTFATGSKDTLNIGGGGWQCSKSNNVNNTTDIVNAYATAYVDPITNEVKVYFGMEVNGAGGSGSVAFWFLQDGTVSCTPGNQATNFTGNHVDGDVLIVAEFTGQRITFIGAYEWVGGAGGSLNETAIVSGGDCKNAAVNDNICATVNSEDTVGTNLGNFTPPWLTQTEQSGAGEGTDLDSREFFEGGISLTNTGLSGCFTQFLANTRTSKALGSTIFDYVLGSFPLCGIGVDKVCTAPTTGNPNPIIDPNDFSSFLTKFDITINKSGPATVFDPEVEEDSTFAAGESCKIIAINGCSSGAPTTPVLNFQNGSPVQVCDTLGATPITVTIECDTFNNGIINSVTARAATSDGGAKGLTAADTMTQQQACSATVNPALRAEKICHDLAAVHDFSLDASQPTKNQAVHPANPAATSLEYDQQGNFTGFGVDVFVLIENTGNFKLENIVVADQVNPPSQNNVLAFTPVTISNGTATHTTTTFNGTLLPGQKAYFIGDYVATAPDNNATDPATAQFSDTVQVTATSQGVALTPVPVDSAICPLCP